MNTAEKIYSASTSEDRSTARLAEQLARLIEDDIASKNIPNGGAMGSLRELSERYAVGRAAVREAVALLERRGLGRLRPGPCGGFIVAQPDAETIGAELANYFRVAGVTRALLLEAREAVDPIAPLAVTARLGFTPDPITPPEHGESRLDWHLRVRASLAEASGEPVVLVFTACLKELTQEFAGQPDEDDGWRVAATACCAHLNQALAGGDPAEVMAAMAALQRDIGHALPASDGPLALPDIDTARHIDDRTLATLVARRLAAEVLRSGTAGQRLGSEWDLSERFSVSRATLRQAIRQLQDSGMVECRRGRGNGLVVRDSRGTGVIRLVLAYLIGHQMDPTVAGTLLFQINRFVPALAVTRASPEQRARLEELLARTQRSDQIDRTDLLALVQCVSQLAENPVIDLFSRSLAAYEARFHPFFVERLPAQMQTDYFGLLRRLLDRIEPGDPTHLALAKQEATGILLDMSRSRPI